MLDGGDEWCAQAYQVGFYAGLGVWPALYAARGAWRKMLRWWSIRRTRSMARRADRWPTGE